MPAAKYRLMIEQGATHKQMFTIFDGTEKRDLSGYTARMQIRENYDTPVVVECTTENGGITLDANGGLELFISDTQTAAIPFIKGKYDIEIIEMATGYITRIIMGDVVNSLEVTK